MDGVDRMEPSHCQICGQRIVAVTWDQELMQVPDKYEPLWDGGPLVAVYGLFPKHEPVPGSQRYTWQCGHEYRGRVTFYTDSPAL